MADYNSSKTGAQIDASVAKADTNETNIATNVTAIGLNTTHRGSDGKDHSDVVTNSAKISFDSTSSTKLGTIEESADVTDEANVSATASVIANSAKVTNATHSGDATGSTALTLATVNSNVGSFTNADVTVNAKGLITAASNGSSSAPEGTAVLSTGETGAVKFLREDGDGTSSWQVPSGSGDMTAAVYDAASIAEQLVGLTATQTLTNKTLTSPKINEDVAVTATATELNYVDGVTSAIQTQIDAKPDSDPSGVTGADAVTNMMSLTQAEYDAITPNASTFYIITT